MKHLLSFRSRLSLLALLLTSFAFSISAQSGYSYYDFSGAGNFTGYTGPMNPEHKVDANSIVDVNDNIARLHGYTGFSPNQACILQITDPAGVEIWNRIFDRPGQDLQPMSVVDAENDGYGVVVYDANNNISYVLFYKYSGGLVWVNELPDVMAKDIAWVPFGITGAPELIVVGQHALAQTSIIHYEVGSGSPITEMLQPLPGGGSTFGYSIISNLAFSPNEYRVVATDGGNNMFVSSFLHNGAYLGSVRNGVFGPGMLMPYSIEEDVSGNLVVAGMAEAGGPNAYIALLDPAGNILWNRHTPSPQMSSYEYAIGNTSSGDIFAVGYELLATGQRQSLVTMYDAFGNILTQNHVYPFLTNNADDYLSGTFMHNGLGTIVATGTARDLSVFPMEVAPRFDFDPAGNTFCQDPILNPNAAFSFASNPINMPPFAVPQTTSAGVNQNSTPHGIIDCFFMKTRHSIAEAAGIPEEAHLTVFPQPATDALDIEVSADELRQVRLIGLDGRVFFEYDYDGEVRATQLNVADLAAGVYFLEVNASENQWTRKVMVQ